jgi:hypothetical protein
MMIREWMYPDGNIAQYDTQTRLIQFLSPVNRENIVPPHVITEDELSSYELAYPEASQEELVARQAVIASLQAALLGMREITSDNAVSSSEISAALPQVRTALEFYRDYSGRTDEVMERLINLLLSQSILALQILISNSGTTVYNTVVQGQIIKGNLEILEDRFNDHITDFHS